jgi:hypothetical protein
LDVQLQLISQSGFLSWLKDNVYVAACLSPLLALIAMIFKRETPNSGPVNWSLRIVYIASLTCLAAVFTPIIDPEVKLFAGFVAAATLIFIAVHAADADEKTKNHSSPRE